MAAKNYTKYDEDYKNPPSPSTVELDDGDVLTAKQVKQLPAASWVSWLSDSK